MLNHKFVKIRYIVLYIEIKKKIYYLGLYTDETRYSTC